jgi:hypothetical protein
MVYDTSATMGAIVFQNYLHDVLCEEAVMKIS